MGGRSWVNHSLSSHARLKSLPWIVKSLVPLKWKSVLCYSLFVIRGHNLTKDLYADSKREGLGGMWIATCTRARVCVYICIYVIYVYMLVCKQFASVHYLFPIHWYTHTQKMLSKSPPVSSFSQRFSPGNPLDLPLLSSMFTVIQSPQNSAKKWALLLSNPVSYVKTPCLGWRTVALKISFCMGLFLEWGPVIILISGTVEKPRLYERTGTIMEEQQAGGS